MKKRTLALILSVFMLFALTACGGEETSSDLPEINYGNEVDTEDDDDETMDGTTTTVIQGGSSGNKSPALDMDVYENVDVPVINKKAKTQFLESVPKSLKGKTVSILTWWEPMDNEVAKMKTFEKETGIKIKWIPAIGDYASKLASMIAANNSPDIAGMRNADFPTSILQGRFRPISESKLDLTKTDVFDKETINNFKINGEVYGIVVKGSSLLSFNVLTYNNDIFINNGIKTPAEYFKAGEWNRDTFLELCKQIKTKTGLTAIAGEYGGHQLVKAGGLQAVEVINGKLVSNIDNSDYRENIRWVTRLSTTEKVADWGMSRDSFINGKCAMYLDTGYALQSDNVYSKAKINLGFVPVPSPKGVNKVYGSTQLWGFPVSNKAGTKKDNIEAASYALEYWQNPVYDEEGNSMWLNSSVSAFISYCYSQPKSYTASEGVVSYSGDYSYNTMLNDLLNYGPDSVDTQCAKWSKVISANIKKISDEWS